MTVETVRPAGPISRTPLVSAILALAEEVIE
jgi:hypothetical protein